MLNYNNSIVTPDERECLSEAAVGVPGSPADIDVDTVSTLSFIATLWLNLQQVGKEDLDSLILDSLKTYGQLQSNNIWHT